MMTPNGYFTLAEVPPNRAVEAIQTFQIEADQVIEDLTVGAGTGDVVGPSSAVNERIAVYDGITGKLLKDGGSTIADIVAGVGAAPLSATYITQTANGTLTNEFALSSLATGLLKNTTGTGVPTIAAAGTDYLTPTGNGSGLTNLNANNLSSGIVPDARFPTILPALSGANLTSLNASNLSSGTVDAARMPALTGDVTTSAGSVSTTIANNVVSLAKMADIATASFMGRNTAGTGDPEVLSMATAKTMLGLSGSLTQGSVVFAGVSGVLAEDNANFFWDDTNNRLGLGVASPQQLLHVKGSNPSIRIEDTTAPNTGEITVTSDFIGIGANRNNVSGARFNVNKATASIFMMAANANSSIAFGTTPTNNTDPIQRMMIDKDGKVLIGSGSPSQLFEVTGNVFINSATANLFLKDISTGWQSASTTVITPQANNAIRSTNYTSGLIGWTINAIGDIEANNLTLRGALRTSILLYNAVLATNGSTITTKSAAKLRTDVVIPASPTYGTTTVTIDVNDQDGLSHVSSQLFVVNDILFMKDGLLGLTWFKVTAVSDQTTFWRYTASIQAGTNNTTYRAGLGVLDYGQSGAGFIVQTADQANSPYLQMATHAATFSSSDASGTLIATPRLRLGNLNGSYGYASDVYGFGTGQYGTSGQSWVTVDPTNGVRIGSNTTTRIQLAADGSGFVANNNASWTNAGVFTISGWTINATSMSSSTTYVAANVDPPAGQVTWYGKSATGYQGLFIRDASSRQIDMLVGNSTIYPYLRIHDGTRARVVLGGLNNAWGGDGSTNSMGMKIWDSSGSKLVEFSDVQNVIAGLNITATRASVGSGSSTAGLDSTVTGGDDVRIFAGDSTPSSAPFRVTESGALTATNATITGTITATSGSFAGSLSAATGTFTGDLTGTTMSLTGKLSMSGASSAITIGTTPPTTATDGTGIWIDRTGVYSLNGDVEIAKINFEGVRIYSFDGLKFSNSGADQAFIGSNSTGGIRVLAQPSSGSISELLLHANESVNSRNVRLKLATTGSDSRATLYRETGLGSNFLGLTIGADSAPTALLDVRSDSIRISTAKTPASASATGTQGMIAWDASFIYICTATDTWKRVAISSW